MCSILRKLHRKRHWDPDLFWHERHDVYPQTLRCLDINIDAINMELNSISVFLFTNELEMKRILAALALTRDNLNKIDFAILPMSELDDCEIVYRQNLGTTPDKEVNQWHFDLTRMTLFRLTELASRIKDKGEIQRYSETKVEDAIRQSLTYGEIDRNAVSPKLPSSLTKRNINF